MHIYILTIFPDFFTSPLSESLIKKAQENNLIQIRVIDIREYSRDKHKVVDDTPFGGGGGMVLMVEPLALALDSIIKDKKEYHIILTSARGKKFDQEKVKELSGKKNLVVICGHYKGIDERIKSLYDIKELSIGDYVLTGGELPALVIIDSVVRLIPGFMGNFQSAENDSFYQGLLGYPEYTRPSEFKGLKVPEVLLSGNHEKIRMWRRKEALKRTLELRPDLLEKIELGEEDKKLVAEIEKER
ncbi:MAG: tRNA (guanosine(37)-N1)-methyltransferase TrmD [candidate division Zixibacteria bacterium]|nr:tRNA (guanosine(37)-N1)-methyltransferase TrmD [candidate division Zixibacteria bacterium]